MSAAQAAPSSFRDHLAVLRGALRHGPAAIVWAARRAPLATALSLAGSAAGGAVSGIAVLLLTAGTTAASRGLWTAAARDLIGYALAAPVTAQTIGRARGWVEQRLRLAVRLASEEELARALAALPYAAFEGGPLQARIALARGGLGALQGAVDLGVGLASSVASAASVAAVLGHLSPALAMAACVPPLVAMADRYHRFAVSEALYRGWLERQRGEAYHAELLQGAGTVKELRAFGAEPWVLARWRAGYTGWQREETALDERGRVQSGAVGLVQVGIRLAAFGAAAAAVLAGRLPAGALTGTLDGMGRVQGAMDGVMGGVISMIADGARAGDLFEFLRKAAGMGGCGGSVRDGGGRGGGSGGGRDGGARWGRGWVGPLAAARWGWGGDGRGSGAPQGAGEGGRDGGARWGRGWVGHLIAPRRGGGGDGRGSRAPQGAGGRRRDGGVRRSRDWVGRLLAARRGGGSDARDVGRAGMDACTVGRAVPSDWAEIRLEGVSYRYPGGGEPVLRDVSLTLRRGYVTALIGVNGAGKTTVLKVLAGLLEPDEGRVTIGGVDLREVARGDYWRRLAVLFQGGPRYHLPLREAVGLAAWAGGGAGDAAVRAALGRAGLDGSVDLDRLAGTEFSEDGLGLSGGQWQRLDLARVYCHAGAEVVMLDEPSSALDPEAEVALYREFQAAIAGAGGGWGGAGRLGHRDSGRVGGSGGGDVGTEGRAGATGAGAVAEGGVGDTGTGGGNGAGWAGAGDAPDGRRTGLLVSHRLGPVRHADHIIVLNGRVVAEDGNHEALMARGGLYARMFREQQAMYR